MPDDVAMRVRPARPDPGSMAAVGSSGMISTSHPAATAAGVAALRRGGSAVDAYLAAAAVQTVVEPTMTSLAGGLAISVYNPDTRRSRVVAGMATKPAGEQGELDDDARSSGRTVVTPGWVSGAHAAWRRSGRLPWADLFGDAIACARDGFVVDQLLWGTMWEYRAVAGRCAAGREVWFPDGWLVGVGDVLRQPALARTLEELAAHGPESFYQGDFAREYVDAARAAGGAITPDDMSAAQEKIIDLELPVLALANGDELHTTGFMYALALNVATVGGLAKRDRPPDDGETLYLVMRTVQECWHHNLEATGPTTAGFDESALGELAEAVSPEAAERLWPQVGSGPPRPFEAMNLNTNAIVAVDDSGMVAYGTHSTSSTPFGVGLMAGGVVVPRPLYYFASRVTPIPAGWGTSLLAMRGGRPVLAVASPSISAFENVLQNTLDILEWGLEPGDAVQQARFGAAMHPSTRPMVEAAMGDAVIDEVERRGLAVTRVSPWEPEIGSCHAIHMEGDGALRGAADPRRLGAVAGS